MKDPTKTLIFLLIPTIIITSCITFVTNEKENEPQNQQTAYALTVGALHGDLGSLQDETAQPMANLTSGSAALSDPSCNSITDIKDITIKDGAQAAPGEALKKIWEMKNNGSCTWNTDYHIALISIPEYSIQVLYPLEKTVRPGETVEISVPITAPQVSGTYTYYSYWKMQSSLGETFGGGEDGDASFWVKIVVPGPDPEQFAVTSVDINTTKINITSNCPTQISAVAEIKGSGAGKVTYEWRLSSGQKKVGETSLNNSGNVSVSEFFSFDSDFNGTLEFYVDQPNHQMMKSVPLSLKCTQEVTPLFANVTKVEYVPSTRGYIDTCPLYTDDYKANITYDEPGPVIIKWYLQNLDTNETSWKHTQGHNFSNENGSTIQVFGPSGLRIENSVRQYIYLCIDFGGVVDICYKPGMYEEVDCMD